ncbi:unnamed protein product, partial [Symbiodinium sp. KB8]
RDVLHPSSVKKRETGPLYPTVWIESKIPKDKKLVHAVRFAVPGDGVAAYFYWRSYFSSTDLLRVGGLLFGDPVLIADGAGGVLQLPGPHRTLLWKSRITSLRWSIPGERFSTCSVAAGCEDTPVFHKRVLLGVIPVGGNEFSDSNVVSSSFREKLPLLEKSLDGLLVEIPSTTRTFQHAFEGMEVLLCGENCVQGLFNVPGHVPRLLVQDPSIDMRAYCPPVILSQES